MNTANISQYMFTSPFLPIYNITVGNLIKRLVSEAVIS